MMRVHSRFTNWNEAPPYVLAILDLGFPAALVYLLAPVISDHRSSIGNWPSVYERALVSAVFLAAALFLLTRYTRLGVRLSAIGVASNLALILWFWRHGRIVFTIEIVGWLVLDIVILGLLLLPRLAPVHDHGSEPA